MTKLEYIYPDNVNEIDERGRTALMIAANEGQLDRVIKLVELGADINIQNDDGWSALLASRTAEVANFLIENGADINAVSRSQFNSLMMASVIGSKNLVSYLIKRGISIHSQTEGGWTPLLQAVSSGNLDVVSYIVEQGAVSTCRMSVDGLPY
ncbi:ankyrin repeat domain-containing protein [Shewanella woodyi]|uniref:ankyrin repeat domain-containing protein n=1 Tax=Shewanella woodyi TaxID=60961 RepID=UPI0037491A3E